MHIVRHGSFDAGHRIMNEKFKCFNIHGHTYIYELTFSEVRIERLGYAMDAKELKRLAGGWIDEFLDHGIILNPSDIEMIEVANSLGSKKWIMSLEEGRYCNPSAENIARELYLSMEILFSLENVIIESVKLHETPNFHVVCDKVSSDQRAAFYGARQESIKAWKYSQGRIKYDDGK